MAVSAANSDDLPEIHLLDGKTADLVEYEISSLPAGGRVAFREPHYYLGMFQSGRTYEKDNCTEPGINDFPPDMFTEWQRKHGAIVVHFLFIIYSMAMICNVVDDFFVPSLDIISDGNQREFFFIYRVHKLKLRPLVNLKNAIK